ncbi:replication protein A 70 kDa DNA-binding subunit C-like protein [Tanacetum coccineum]
MSTKPAGTSLSIKIAYMAAPPQSNLPLFLDELKVDGTGSIIVMVGRVWDVNATTGRYLSTDFVVSDSKGNMIHCTAKATIAHNFLRLKEGGIFLIKNFVVLPNKDEFRVFRHDMFMLEFDGSTTIRKVSANSVGFVRYTFQLVDFDDIELTNNKYMIGAFLMIAILCAKGQSLRVTLWGGVGDSLIEKKTVHVGICAIVLTSMTAKTYNNKLYLSSTSSTIIYDNDDIPSLLVEPNKEMMTVDYYQPREGIVENLLLWARNRKNDVYSDLPMQGDDLRYQEKEWVELSLLWWREMQEECFPQGRKVPMRDMYRLEVVVDVDTAHTSVEDDSGLPTAIRNLICTTHVMELKSYTYYEYGSYESFTCWKINPADLVDNGASSSNQLITVDDSEPSFKRLTRQLSVCTPSKPNEEKSKKRSELEDSDTDEVLCSTKDPHEINDDGPVDKKKRKM